MATVKTVVGAPSALTVTGLGTLAAGTYVASANYNAGANDPVDLIVEVTCATTNTPAGNKQVAVFASASWDGGATYQSGPTSGTRQQAQAMVDVKLNLAIRLVAAKVERALSVTTSAQGHGPRPAPRK